MKKLTLITAVLASVSIASTAAQAYQTELNGGYAYTKFDNNDDIKNHNADIGATYYFNPVDTSKGPLAEAAFLNRANNVGVQYDYNKTEFNKDSDSDVDHHQLGINGEYYIPDTNFYTSAGLGWGKYKYNGGDKSDNDGMVYQAEVGYLPTPGLLLAVGLAGRDDNGESETDPTIRAKYVKQLAGDTALNLEGKARFNDNNDAYDVGADYYLDRTLSLGANYERTNFDNNNESVDAFGLRARKFFTENVSAEGSVGFGDDTTTFGVRGTYRF